ncbi:MAG: ATP-binding cassette domain-containing protein [Candidatus Omnitrophota bacterium]
MEIICKNVSKSYLSGNRRLNVLDDINVEVEDGDFVCILGPNGCGKTTLFKILAGIIKPTEGSVFYVGKYNHYLPISLIFQEQGLFPWLNVIDNICFNLEMKGLTKKNRYARAEKYIEKLGLANFLNYYPYQLSTGMKQKVSLIRGLITDSTTLLIDEACASLDIYSKLIIQEDIYRIWSEYNRTVLYITHDVEEALRVAKHIWIMGKCPGKIIRILDMELYRSDNIKNGNDLYLNNIKNQVIGILKQESRTIIL